MQAREQYYLFTAEGINSAIELSTQAIEVDPQYAEAYATKSNVIMFTLISAFNQSVKESLYSAIELAKKAIELDDLLPRAHASLAWSLMWHREIDEAINEIERAVELDPNCADTRMWQSMILSSAGKGSNALEAIEKAMRINPHYHVTYIFSKATAFFTLGQYKEANFYYDSGISFNPNFIPNYLLKIPVLSLLDKYDEMLVTKDKILKILE